MMVFFVVIGFLCGSCMFSYWLGFAVKKDLKTVGDGNPGAFNLWRAAGYKLGLLGIVLDFAKGYLPLVLLYESGILTDSQIVPVSLAPILGHVFPPLAKFKGGKAIAVTFGVWSAITRFQVSLALAVILAAFQLAARLVKKGKKVSSEEDGVMVVAGMLVLGLYLKAVKFPDYYFLIWLGNLFIFIFANRGNLYKYWKEKAEKRIPYRY